VFSAEVLSGGEVLFTVNAGLHIGELDGSHSTGVDELVERIDSTGLVAVADPDIEALEWGKFIAWASVAAPAVLTRLETGTCLSAPGVAAFSAALVLETTAVSAAKGVTPAPLATFPLADLLAGNQAEAAVRLVDLGRVLAESMPDHRVSILQDLLRGRRLEVEETFGHVTRLAADLGVSVPALGMSYGLIGAISDSTT